MAAKSPRIVMQCFADLDAARVRSETFVASVEVFDELGSTNDHAQETAGSLPLPRLIVAARQTSGRGREGRTWWTGQGSLAASLVIDPGALGIAPRFLPRIAMAVGAALVDAVKEFLPAGPLGLHWPNDVYLLGRKLAGVLCETSAGGEFIIGCGVNVNNSAADAPAGVRERVVTLRDVLGEPLSPTDFVIAFCKHLHAALVLLRSRPEALAARCHDLLLGRGEPLTIRTGTEVLTGTCRGIAPDGALLLETAGGLRALHSGSTLP